MEIGRSIRWARERIGLSQSAFAEALGVHRSWVFRLERGQFAVSFEHVAKSAEMFGMTIEQMRLGDLPERVRQLTKSQRRSALKEYRDDVVAVECGRMPSAEFIQWLSVLLEMDPDHLCYGCFHIEEGAAA